MRSLKGSGHEARIRLQKNEPQLEWWDRKVTDNLISSDIQVTIIPKLWI